LRNAAETNNKKLEEMLHEKNDDLNKVSLMNNSLKDNLDKSQNCNKKLDNDKERYKNYIMILTEETQKLSNELENILEEDEKIFESIEQTDKLNKFICEQKAILNDVIESSTEFLASDLQYSPTYKSYIGYSEC
jgi:chromosome segregation ATPase